MGENQTQITGHIEITGLGCNGERLTGKTVTVYTLDGNIFSGDVIKANHIVVYITETDNRIRMIKTSAIASILMGKEDAEQLMTEKKIVLSTVVPKRPISVPGDLPSF